jgi:hypothetical protein
MKTPRIEGFDPNAQKKKPPTLKSALDDMPAIEKHSPLETHSSPQPERANARTIVRPNGRRIITRNSFETYEDQMESLRKLAFRQKMEGKLGSMSAMVREAIDEYLERNAS